MATEDVSHLLPGEGQEEPQETAEQQPQAEQQVEQAPEELVPFKWGNRQHEVPKSLLEQLSQYVEDDPEEIRNSWQRGKDYSRAIYEARREAAALRAQLAERQGYNPTPQPQAQQQPGKPQFDPDDPISQVRFLAQSVPQQMQEMREQFNSWIQAQQQAQQAQAMERESQLLKQTYDTWSERKRAQGFKNVPSIEEMDQLAASLGLGSTDISYDKAFEVTWLHYYGDQVAQHQQKAAVDKLRDPKARIVVPGATGQAPKPKAESAESQLSGMTVAQMREFYPER